MTSNRLVWPLAALAALIVLNAVFTPSFLALRIQDGHLFGSLVDILRNGAPTLLIALGMTLVIATRGIDLSVGAVAAIAAAVTCTHIAATGDAITGMLLALGLCVLLGLWNGFLVTVLGIQPIIATLVLMTAAAAWRCSSPRARSSPSGTTCSARSARGSWCSPSRS
ncbi:hypothetical protein ACFQV2_13360 [Actinokineospora soli]|uniref:Branched-chain amino acid transport system / permease component n=1 Tax=Actinokineospora soli TaxID=1048753 RepID=A0ABW2TMA4_9PSEU